MNKTQDLGLVSADPVADVARNRLEVNACRIALVFGSFRGGGVARSMLRTAEGLVSSGYRVDLVVGRAEGDLLDEVPAGADVVELERSSAIATRAYAIAAKTGETWALLRHLVLSRKISGKFRYLISLVRYIRRTRPDAIFAATAPFNLISVWARNIASIDARVVITEHNQLAPETLGKHRWRYDCSPALLRSGYLHADTIAAVSDGVANELAEFAGIPRQRITVLYNPVVGPHVLRGAQEPVDHPWFARGEPPVLLGVGMLKPQKDFPTLIRAFALVRQERPVRLLILGDVRNSEKDGVYRAELLALPSALGVEADVAFPGFVENPFSYMGHAAAFVLSSAWEGLPTVLIEALGCGCPVVSTDCPSGPAEILDHGRYGPLVPVGDEMALAAAIKSVLDSPLHREVLKNRAHIFSTEQATAHQIQLLFGDSRAS
jgi:glycosyltransferase involved in cell wall biosynthesis